MEITRSFNETVRTDLASSKAFRSAYLVEAIQCLIQGDLETGKIALREYINATIGFIPLGAALNPCRAVNVPAENSNTVPCPQQPP